MFDCINFVYVLGWKMNINEVMETKKLLEKIKEEAEAKLQELDLIQSNIKNQEKTITKVAESLEKGISGLVEKEQFIKFFEKPYALIPGKNFTYVVVPKFIKGFQVGWLWKETDNYFIYQVNQYSKWLGDIPKDLLDSIKTEEEVKAELIVDTVYFNPSDKNKIKTKFGKHLKEFTENTAKIIQGHEFNLIVDMIETGTLPFKPTKVLESDLRVGKSKIELRNYQQPAYDKFLEVGAIGLFHPTGAGKSIIALKAIDNIKGEKLIVVPSRSLIEQWNYYIETYVPHLKNEIQLVTYQGFRNINKEYSLIIFDECHKLPANTFSRLALIKTKYRMGLSASPHREDGRESYIFALTGFPIGLNWAEYMKTTGKSYHPINVYIVDTPQQKEKKVETLISRNRKTLIFSDSLDLGTRISKKLKVPFIYGDSQNRLETINNNAICVISRVGDLGISIKNLQQIIEVDFLFGSRQQELQRTGRLMHSEEENTRHDIIMTKEELERYGKRLWSLQEKGFRVKIIEEIK